MRDLKLNGILSWAFFKCLALLLPLIVTSSQSSAASFACSKPAGVEKIICADWPLSLLDEQLAIAYRISLKSGIRRSEGIADQRKWIAETRDRCQDERCLSRVYKERVSWLESEIKRKGVRCEISDTDLVGDWERLKDGDFEEFSMHSDSGERQFDAWLHHRPETSGTWKFENCVLHIADEHGPSQDAEYTVLGLDRGVLYLKSTGRGESSLYRKIRK